MSHTELHIGKLKIIRKEMTIEELKIFLNENEGLVINDFEYLIEKESTFFQIQEGDFRGAYKFIYNKGIFYEVLEHRESDDFDLDETKDNGDGTIDFIYTFYNGGTYFSEMLEEGLDKIHKS